MLLIKKLKTPKMEVIVFRDSGLDTQPIEGEITNGIIYPMPLAKAKVKKNNLDKL